MVDLPPFPTSSSVKLERIPLFTTGLATRVVDALNDIDLAVTLFLHFHALCLLIPFFQFYD